jgi:hypothetical protein
MPLDKPAGGADRLGEATRSKERTLTINDKEIRVRKWSLELSFTLTGIVVDIVKALGKQIVDSDNIVAMMQSDIGPMLVDQYPRVKRVLVETLLRTNPFPSKEELDAWIEELALDEAIDILSVIAEQNMRPLARALGKVAGALGIVKALSGGDLPGRQPLTSSPISSPPDSPTKP